MTIATKPPEWDVFEGLTVDSADAPLALATLAYVVHLKEGSVILLRDDESSGAWRRQFNARLRTCGPWDEEQVVDYLSMTYGSDAAKWPFSKATIARVFHDPKPDRWLAIARDTPAVHSYLSSRSHRICRIPEPHAGQSRTRGESR